MQDRLDLGLELLTLGPVAGAVARCVSPDYGEPASAPFTGEADTDHTALFIVLSPFHLHLCSARAPCGRERRIQK